MNDTMPKTELDAAQNIMDKIIDQPIDEIKLIDRIPVLSEMKDSNQVFKGKVSILFVDMRGSTDLTDEHKSKKMVKVYRSFIRMAVQAIRYCGGQSRQFAGDGVLGIFQDTYDNDTTILSGEKAVRAARYMLTLIDYCVNPKLSKKLGFTVSCGIGISTGNIMATKIGMRGNETEESLENEQGIAWIGKTTNYASRYCSLAQSGEIFIDGFTLKELRYIANWGTSVTRLKGTKSFTGYVTQDYYLEVPDDAGVPVKSKEIKKSKESFVQEIFEEMKIQAAALMDEVGEKMVALNEKERKLTTREISLDARSDNLDEREQKINEISLTEEYKAKYKILKNAKKEKLLLLGKEYCINSIERLKKINSELGKDFDWSECYNLSAVYLAFEMYTEYYFMVCEEVRKGGFIYEHEITPIIEHTSYRTSLIDAIKLANDKLNEGEKKDTHLRIIKMLEGIS